MVPNINRNGRSFRGAGAYHLHDKGDELQKHPATATRVPWTATRNLVNEDPELAIDEMWHTAEAAAHLKRLSGRGKGGTRCDDPVKTISLSWAPHQTPTRQDMQAAADSFLTAMGWQEHQALLIAHTDTAHPHLHIILNRIHPETGIVLNDWKEQRRAQRWGDRFDAEQGLVLCPIRAEKYQQARLDLQADGMPYPYAPLIREEERAFDHPLAAAAVQDLTEKDMLAERHREQREAFLASGKAQFRQARQAAYREVRDEFKPHWREHFRHDRDLNDRLGAKTEVAGREAVRLAREGDLDAAAERLAAMDEERRTVLDDLAASRKDLRQQQLDTTRERQDLACRALIELRALAFQEIKDRQKEERAEFRDLIALRDAGQPYDIDRLQKLIGEPETIAAVNDNLSPDHVLQAAHRNEGLGALLPGMLEQHDSGSPLFRSILEGSAAEPGPRPSSDGAAGERAPRRNPIDGIASAISLGISLLEGLTTPSSPLDRARAKVAAVRHQEEAAVLAAELREQKLRDDFTRHALTAVAEAQAEHERERTLEYDERGRSRERER